MSGEKDLKTLLKSINPIRNDGDYVFCTGDKELYMDQKDVIMSFQEAEGTTNIMRKEVADSLNLNYGSIFNWITLMVHSSLEAVGLTAAFSTALAEKGISCNIVSGYYHDHLFIRKEDCEKAMEVLARLSGAIEF
jgi:hypothetical protein